MKLMRFISALCFLLSALPLAAQPFADVTYAQPVETASGPTLVEITGAEEESSSSPVNGATTVTAPVGTLIVVVIISQAADPATGVTDSAGNTYTMDVTVTASLGYVTEVYSAYVGTELASGGTITITPPGFRSFHWRAYKISSGPSSSHLDVTASSVNGFSTSHPTGTTGTVAGANEIAVAVWATGSGNTYTLASYAKITDEASAFTGGQFVVGWQEVDSGTAAETMTLGSATSSGGCIAVYKTQ